MSSDELNEIVLLGTGNEYIAESPTRHRHHDNHAGDDRFGGFDERQNGNLDERNISWDDRAAFLIGGKGNERMRWWKVYAMHFLFMWNSRTFEYVSVSVPCKLWPQY